MSSSNTLEIEAPISLRADRELTGLPLQRAALPGSTPARVDPADLSLVTLTAAGVAAVAGLSWIVQRRRRVARRTEPAPAPVAVQPVLKEGLAPASGVPEARPSSAPSADLTQGPQWPRGIELAEPVLTAAPLPLAEATQEPMLEGDGYLPPDSTLPQELALALGREVMVVPPLRPPAGEFEEVETEGRRRRPSAWSVGFRRFLMKFLLLARTVAGGASILAAIAIVVFWAIELIDASTRETQLNLVLLGVVLATGVGAWCCGWIANQLHRSLYNRNHPKFDD